MAVALFGTDGVRGKANKYPMTPDIAMKIGIAAGKVLKRGPHRHTVVIGKDTRISGYIFEPALTAGFISMGIDVTLVGPMPTPAVAMLTKSLRADLGVMISASHNPYQDNGIKLFGPDGYKLSDHTEAQIESLVICDLENSLAEPENIGRARRLEDADGRYIEFAKNTFPKGLRLDGLKVVIDCANGAAYKTAPQVLWELGAEIICIGNRPDGLNINSGCGSTDTSLMQKTVIDSGADLGIALDGDADRVLLSDERGNLVDGDQLLAVIASSLMEEGQLQGGGVVATVMSNIGLENYIKGLGLKFIRTNIGDRNVIQAMLSRGMNLGGEQSGHIILSEYNSTGDGLVASLRVLSTLLNAKKPVSQLCASFEAWPQKLVSVPFIGENPLVDKVIQEKISKQKDRLSDSSRLLIRESGTEPVIRIMGESDNTELLNEVIDELVDIISAGPE
ncbi:MAG: phosphoglucosamine mutase [Pseudomonadota bacterium]|nr:phosphoglucosamine mutase [Pseudomonadota bacterium]MEC9077904.1 phosphoglucosamine mutase [Pseudomonadota bacterium]